jgi:hypothetical protein
MEVCLLFLSLEIFLNNHDKSLFLLFVDNIEKKKE